jgi:hypothetical protein
MLQWVEEGYEDFITTGLAVVDPLTIVVSTSVHLFKVKLQPIWSQQVHWPISFRRAAKEIILIGQFGRHHAQVQCCINLNLLGGQWQEKNHDFERTVIIMCASHMMMPVTLSSVKNV